MAVARLRLAALSIAAAFVVAAAAALTATAAPPTGNDSGGIAVRSARMHPSAVAMEPGSTFSIVGIVGGTKPSAGVVTLVYPTVLAEGAVTCNAGSRSGTATPGKITWKTGVTSADFALTCIFTAVPEGKRIRGVLKLGAPQDKLERTEYPFLIGQPDPTASPRTRATARPSKSPAAGPRTRAIARPSKSPAASPRTRATARPSKSPVPIVPVPVPGAPPPSASPSVGPTPSPPGVGLAPAEAAVRFGSHELQPNAPRLRKGEKFVLNTSVAIADGVHEEVIVSFPMYPGKGAATCLAVRTPPGAATRTTSGTTSITFPAGSSGAEVSMACVLNRDSKQIKGTLGLSRGGVMVDELYWSSGENPLPSGEVSPGEPPSTAAVPEGSSAAPPGKGLADTGGPPTGIALAMGAAATAAGLGLLVRRHRVRSRLIRPGKGGV